MQVESVVQTLQLFIHLVQIRFNANLPGPQSVTHDVLGEPSGLVNLSNKNGDIQVKQVLAVASHEAQLEVLHL